MGSIYRSAIALVVRYYASYVAPESSGIVAQKAEDAGGKVVGSQIISVMPGSAAARAGLRAGDMILPSKSADSLLSWEYQEAGRTYRLDIRRNEEDIVVSLTLKRRGFLI